MPPTSGYLPVAALGIVQALDPATGEIDWYYQFVPGESYDLDEAFESLLIDRGGRKSLFKMGKLGILFGVPER